MSIKLMSQLIFSLLLFFFSAGVAWYEGSALLDQPLEWKYTAVVSEMLNGQVRDAHDIVFLDYFVYAAKFAPLFPILMLLSGIYLLVLIAYMVLNKSGKRFSYFLLGTGVMAMVSSGLSANSTSSGMKMICLSLLGIGLSATTLSLIRLFSNEKKTLSGVS